MMKRTYIAVLLLLLAGMIHASSAYARSGKFYAILAAYRNEVAISRGEATVPVTRGMGLHTGDKIKTGKDSFADIAFDGAKRNVIRIEENSELVLKSIDPRARELELFEGSVLSRVKKLGRKSTFVVKTPISISGARGSGWRVSREGTEKDKIESHDDKIFAAGLDADGNPIGEVTLVAGWKIFVERFKRPEGLIKLLDEEREGWRSWREDFGRMGRRQRRIEEKTSDIETGIGKVLDKKEEFFESLDSKKIKDRDGSSGGGCSITPGTNNDSGR